VRSPSPRIATSYIPALFGMGLFGLFCCATLLGGCTNSTDATNTATPSAPVVGTTADASVPAGSLAAEAKPSGEASKRDDATTEATENPGEEGFTDLEQSIVALATQHNDPFLIAMPATPLSVEKTERDELMPFYQTLLAVSPLVTLVDPPAPEVIVDAAPVELDKGPSPAQQLSGALASVQVNGISYQRNKPMAVLQLGGSGNQANTTVLAKAGEEFSVGGVMVKVKSISTNAVTVIGRQASAVQTMVLPIADIHGFARGTGNATSAPTSGLSASASPRGGSEPSSSAQLPAGGTPSSQELDKIIGELLK
jgi:hypothetical protein